MMLHLFKVESFNFVRGVVAYIQEAVRIDKVVLAGSIDGTQMSEVAFKYWQVPGGYRIEFDRAEIVSLIGIEISTSASVTGGYLLLEASLDSGGVRELLSSKTIVFLGCARDCAPKIDATVTVLKRLGCSFLTSSIVVYENDSVDGTRTALNNLATPGEIFVLGDSGVAERIPSRTERLAFARNNLIRWVETQMHYSPDYVCWVDMDGIVDENFSDDGFFSCFQWPHVWDAVFPVCDGFYYDIWALRHWLLCPDDYVVAMRGAPKALGPELIVPFAAYSRQLDLSLMLSWLGVESAFGGMGIYRWSVLKGRAYSGVTSDREICEHVGLNQSIYRDGGKLYLNPRFLVSYPDFEKRNALLSRAYRLKTMVQTK